MCAISVPNSKIWIQRTGEFEKEFGELSHLHHPKQDLELMTKTDQSPPEGGPYLPIPSLPCTVVCPPPT